jgi:FKBP-type peptidyl-prolyl cis-trans isomerase FkpA
MLLSGRLLAGDKDSTVYYNLPDSVKAISFLASVWVDAPGAGTKLMAGIKTDRVSLALVTGKKKRSVVFSFPAAGVLLVPGLNVERTAANVVTWPFDWAFNEPSKLYISTTSDSAGNFIFYSGYIHLAKENKWKLIGTCRLNGQWGTLHQPASFTSFAKQKTTPVTFSNVWCQRRGGGWKNLQGTTEAEPVLRPFSNTDSAAQAVMEKKQIETTATGIQGPLDAIYYQMLKTGTGKAVALSDTVSVFYKGYLFNGGAIFDETKGDAVRFPLNRLIKGWQTGLPLCAVGGKIKLIIPSGQAYGIRTLSTSIPPNSVLVFEIEVTEATPSQ